MTPELVLSHLSGIFAALWVSSIYEALKRTVGPIRPGWRAVFYQQRRTVPVVLGALLALVPTLAAPPPFESGFARFVYFGVAGAMSSKAYGLAQQYLQKKGYVLPGSSFPPGPR